MTQILTKRALNRAALARQLLLKRARVDIVSAVECLAGMQAQVPRPPFVGLWSRLDGFQRDDLVSLIERHELLRGTLMRATLHLVSRTDFALFRAALAPDLTRVTKSILGVRADGIDLASLLSAARAFFEEEPRTFAELREYLKTSFPKLDERAMGYMVRLHLPLIQIPRSGERWAYPAIADFGMASPWVKPLKPDQSPQHELALRYFAAFGPASVRDLQMWSGMSGARAIVDKLRPKLQTFHDESGRELFDLPDAPRPDEDEVVPIRFLPEYDNLMVAYAERSRIIDSEHRPNVTTKNLLVPATLLVDGFAAGIWKVESKKNSAKMLMFPFGKLSKTTRAELAEKAEELLRFIEPNAAAISVEFS